MNKEEIMAMSKADYLLLENNYDCSYCNDCSYCYKCSRCSHCYGCWKIFEGSYMILNVQLTKEEYETKMTEWK